MIPRAYNREERQRIRQRLIAAAEELFARHGLRKTTVDDLVDEVRIGKGSFYQFFDSKEELFLAVQERIEAEVKARLEEELKALRHDPPHMVRAFFEITLEVLEQHPFLRRVAEPETLDLLLVRVSPQSLEEHQHADRLFYRKLFRGWIRQRLVRGIDEKTLFALLVALFILHQQREGLGEHFEPAVEFLVGSAVQHATESPKGGRNDGANGT